MTPEMVIGNKNKLPWHIPQDLQYFKEHTLGKTVIMGRNTFESIKRRALPGRKTIVLSKRLKGQGLELENLEFADTLTEALFFANKHASSEIMIAGGATIYEQFLPLTQQLMFSIMHETFAGDTYFPNINLELWQEISSTKFNEFTAKIFTRK